MDLPREGPALGPTTSSALEPPQFLQTLRRRWKIILASGVITAGAAYGFSVSQPNQYTASAGLLFQQSTLGQQISGTTLPTPITDPNREAATHLALVSLGTISDLTARALHDGLTGGEVQSAISVTSQGQSNVVSVAATDRNPTTAAALANTYAQQYITFSASSDRAKIIQAQRMVQRQFKALPPALQASAQGQSLSNNAEQLSILAQLQTGNARLVQAASVPSSPSSPQPRRDAFIGVALGLLVGLVLALLTERLDRRLRSADELAEVYAQPLLAVIPRDSSLPASPSEVGVLRGVSSESFQLLRSRLRYFNVDRDMRTILVTSARPGEGKTTVAWNLAAAASRAGQSRVLLVEADLRRPQLATWLGLRRFPGLAELITREVTFEEAIQSLSADAQQDAGITFPASNGRTLAHPVDVLVAGAVPPNPTELLESAEANALLRRLSVTYDQIILDTAPVAIVPDAIPLVSVVDGLVVVSRLGKDSRDAARHMRAQLHQLNAPLLGVIANDVKSPADGYYNYASSEASALERPASEKSKSESLI